MSEPPAQENTSVPAKKADGVERLFPPVDLSKIQKALYVSTGVLLFVAIGIIIVASLTDNRDIRETNIISGCVMIIACLIAIYSGRFKDRGGLQLTYILYVWQLGNGSVLLYAGLKDNSKLSDYCEKLRDPSDCNEQLKLAKAQAGLGFFSFFIGLATAWLCSNLSEKIQDEQTNILRAKDIRFAIAAQTAKNKAVNRWQKSYGTNLRGKFKGIGGSDAAPSGSGESPTTPRSSAFASSSGVNTSSTRPELRRQDTKPGAVGIPALPHLTINN